MATMETNALSSLEVDFFNSNVSVSLSFEHIELPHVIFSEKLLQFSQFLCGRKFPFVGPPHPRFQCDLDSQVSAF